jgi:hypothetical protein
MVQISIRRKECVQKMSKEFLTTEFRSGVTSRVEAADSRGCPTGLQGMSYRITGDVLQDSRGCPTGLQGMSYKITGDVLQEFTGTFLCAFAKLRKATISFVMYVCPSVLHYVRMEQLSSHRTDFVKI